MYLYIDLEEQLLLSLNNSGQRTKQQWIGHSHIPFNFDLKLHGINIK